MSRLTGLLGLLRLLRPVERFLFQVFGDLLELLRQLLRLLLSLLLGGLLRLLTICVIVLQVFECFGDLGLLLSELCGLFFQFGRGQLAFSEPFRRLFCGIGRFLRLVARLLEFSGEGLFRGGISLFRKVDRLLCGVGLRAVLLGRSGLPATESRPRPRRSA